MPTGVALQGAREQLFAAAEAVLVRDGPSALTSRAVTTETGCAKGVLHRHFADFDTFLAELVLERARQVSDQSAELVASAGTGSVTDTLSGVLISLFESVAVAVVALVISRDGLRGRLREAGATGVPVLAEAATTIAAYLRAEQRLGRISPEADIDALAPTLIGAVHMLFVGRGGITPEPEAVRRVVTAVIGGATTDPPQKGARYERARVEVDLPRSSQEA